MKKTDRLVPLLAAAIACMALVPVAQAQKLPDADAREVATYTLTKAGLAKYTAALEQLANESDAAGRDESGE
jgi:hypothetical protein